MKLLFDDRLAPITSSIGFLETDSLKAVASFVEWQAPLLEPEGRKLEVRPVSGPFEALLRDLLPLTNGERRRYLFVPTRGAWTAFLDNGYDGGDVAGPMAVLSENLRCRGIRITAQPNSIRKAGGKHRGRFGATILEVYAAKRGDRVRAVRSLAVVNDGGSWRFSQSGEPLPGEHLDRYQAPRLRERFTLELLDEYLRAIGVRAFDETFYAPDGNATLVEKKGPTYPGVRDFQLSEIQMGF